MARVCASALLLLAVCLVAVHGAQAAAVPWRTVANPIRAALSEDGNVTTRVVVVSAKQVTLQVTVALTASKAKAQALSTLLTLATNPKNKLLTQKVVVTVRHGTVVVKTGPTPPTSLAAANLLSNALRNNPNFLSTYLSPELTGHTALFSPRAAQYFTGTEFQRDGLETVTIAQLMELVFGLRRLNVYASSAQCFGKGCVRPIFT